MMAIVAIDCILGLGLHLFLPRSIRFPVKRYKHSSFLHNCPILSPLSSREGLWEACVRASSYSICFAELFIPKAMKDVIKRKTYAFKAPQKLILPSLHCDASLGAAPHLLQRPSTHFPRRDTPLPPLVLPCPTTPALGPGPAEAGLGCASPLQGPGATVWH